MKRRQLDFHSAAEVIAEIESLRANPYTMTGKWNLTQICFHLAATTRIGLEGGEKRLPWILRATVNKWAFRYFLKRRSLLAGAPTLPALRPTESTGDDPAIIDECIKISRRAAEFDGPIRDYPLLNDVSVEDWQNFMWIHAAHHLGFLVPKT